MEDWSSVESSGYKYILEVICVFESDQYTRVVPEVMRLQVVSGEIV